MGSVGAGASRPLDHSNQGGAGPLQGRARCSRAVALCPPNAQEDADRQDSSVDTPWREAVAALLMRRSAAAPSRSEDV